MREQASLSSPRRGEGWEIEDLSCLTASWFSVTPGLTRGPAAVRSVAEEAGPRIKSGVTGWGRRNFSPQTHRHAELVPASIAQTNTEFGRPDAAVPPGRLAPRLPAQWTLKQVQGDDAEEGRL